MTQHTEPRRSLVRRDRFDALQDIQQEMARWLGRSWWPWPAGRLAESGAVWAPRVDIYEEGNELVVKAELPGVNKEDVHITLEGDELVLEGERRSEKELKEENFYRMERRYGSFYRRLPVPPGIAPESVKASFRDGVLEVRMPSPAEAKPATKTIPVT